MGIFGIHFNNHMCSYRWWVCHLWWTVNGQLLVFLLLFWKQHPVLKVGVSFSLPLAGCSLCRSVRDGLQGDRACQLIGCRSLLLSQKESGSVRPPVHLTRTGPVQSSSQEAAVCLAANDPVSCCTTSIIHHQTWGETAVLSGSHLSISSSNQTTVTMVTRITFSSCFFLNPNHFFTLQNKTTL